MCRSRVYSIRSAGKGKKGKAGKQEAAEKKASMLQEAPAAAAQIKKAISAYIKEGDQKAAKQASARALPRFDRSVPGSMI